MYIYIFVPIVTFKIQLQLEDLRLQMGNHLTLGSPIREAPNPGAAKWRVTPHPFGAFADGIWWDTVRDGKPQQDETDIAGVWHHNWPKKECEAKLDRLKYDEFSMSSFYAKASVPNRCLAPSRPVY